MSTAPAGPSRPLRRFALTISIGVNVFLAAVILTHLWFHRASMPAHSADVRPRMERMAASLPAGDGDTLRAVFAGRSDAVTAETTAYHQAQEAIRAALRAEPFDPAALQAAMAAARDRRRALEIELQGVIADTAAKISMAGRAKLAEWPRPR